MFLFFFFFSSRRRHTIWNCDWSSDVCSSDLEAAEPASRNGRQPKLPKADDELTRELRRLIGPEQLKDELDLGHPPEELAELVLDMSFLSQEALEDSEISGLI